MIQVEAPCHVIKRNAFLGDDPSSNQGVSWKNINSPNHNIDSERLNSVFISVVASTFYFQFMQTCGNNQEYIYVGGEKVRKVSYSWSWWSNHAEMDLDYVDDFGELVTVNRFCRRTSLGR